MKQTLSREHRKILETTVGEALADSFLIGLRRALWRIATIKGG